MRAPVSSTVRWQETDILTLLKILLFGGATVITPNPVDIGLQTIDIQVTENIEAITSGASLYIDITREISSDSVFDALNEIDKKYPKGCVGAVLSGKNGDKVLLDTSSGAWSNELVELRLSSQKGVPTDMPFTSIKISSCNEIKSTVVKWRNYSK